MLVSSPVNFNDKAESATPFASQRPPPPSPASTVESTAPPCIRLQMPREESETSSASDVTRLAAGGGFPIEATHTKLVLFSAIMILISTWGAIASTIGFIVDDGEGHVAHFLIYIRGSRMLSGETLATANAAMLAHMWILALAEFPAIITTFVILVNILHWHKRQTFLIGFVVQSVWTFIYLLAPIIITATTMSYICSYFPRPRPPTSYGYGYRYHDCYVPSDEKAAIALLWVFWLIGMGFRVFYLMLLWRAHQTH